MIYWKGRGKVCLVCQAIRMRLLSSSYHIWIDSPFATSAIGKCSLLVSVSIRLRRWSVVQRCTLFAAVNARWTTSNQKLLVLEPQWIQSTERAKGVLIPPVYSLRAIRTYDELQAVVTEVGQVKQMITMLVRFYRYVDRQSTIRGRGRISDVDRHYSVSQILSQVSSLSSLNTTASSHR